MTREREALRRQAQACNAMGSRLYGAILDRCALGEDGGAVTALLASRPASVDLLGEATTLRLLASLHRLALAGEAPALAAHYPSCGGDDDAVTAWPAFVSAVRNHYAIIENELGQPVQTNEVARAAPLLGAFLFLVERRGLPLRLLELGASAGLTLRWDRFRYEAGAWSWGPIDSGVRLTDNFADGGPPFAPDVRAVVAERSGCDIAPIDPTSEEGRRRLLSFVWPDQRDRVARLSAACELARTLAVPVEKTNATRWLETELRVMRAGLFTVVFHTVFLQYLTIDDRKQLEEIIGEAALRATAEAPLAYLSFEPHKRGRGAVVLELWPEAQHIEIAQASLHGRDIRWTQPLR